MHLHCWVLCLLAGISLVDAGSMAVFSVACMVLYKYALRFVQEVDDSTMEVADYTGAGLAGSTSNQQYRSWAQALYSCGCIAVAAAACITGSAETGGQGYNMQQASRAPSGSWLMPSRLSNAVMSCW